MKIFIQCFTPVTVPVMTGIYWCETPAQPEPVVKTGGHFPAPVQIWKGRFGVLPDQSGQMLRLMH
ncbi:hypothetical protein J1L44_001842 [Salmonella enterica subsp. enterica serovar Panama]|nr:hypothetical protein [Salmonella enterica subsp. enterica serovar Panama]